MSGKARGERAMSEEEAGAKTPSAAALSEIARIDREIRDLRRRLEPFETRFRAEKERWEKENEAWRSAKKALEEARLEERALERELSEWEEKRNREEARYRAVKTESAAKAAEKELGFIIEKISEIEERAFEALECVERFEKEADALETRVKDLEARWRKTGEELEAETSRKREIEEDFVRERDELLEKLPAEWSRRYRTLVTSGRVEDPVLEVEDTGSGCPGCGGRLLPKERTALAAGRPELCRECGRILISVLR
ncbi:MAG: hypothetical protein D6679_00170 [Candidatus Hydrogenedentota bacterium]|nr:MAG: hypothetical protein D6679_00170 [Candidatus Hydrogenedentota bacterium]